MGSEPEPEEVTIVVSWAGGGAFTSASVSSSTVFFGMEGGVTIASASASSSASSSFSSAVWTTRISVPGGGSYLIGDLGEKRSTIGSKYSVNLSLDLLLVPM